MSIAIPRVDQMTESERDEMLGKLVLDAFVRRGFGMIPVRVTDASVGLVVPRIDPATISSIPDLSDEYVEEIRRRVKAVDQVIAVNEFRERVVRDLRLSEGE